MSKKEKKVIGNEAIYDARVLGKGKMTVLGIQHMFAMFGATVLVPMLTGLSISTTLLFACLGTLLFHFITGGKVPAFLGSSFAFLGGYGAIAPLAGQDGMTNAQLLPYACLGVACAGLLYLVLATLIRIIGIKRVMKFFPPVVTGPIIICVGLQLAGGAVENCATNWLIALVALFVVIIFNIWGKGMAKIVPIVLGVLCAYAVAVGLDIASAINPELTKAAPAIFTGKNVDFTPVVNVFNNIASGNIWNNLVGVPIKKEATVLAIDWSNTSLIVSSIVAIVPLALATMMEHIGDISAISSTVGKNYIKKPGLHRTLIGDGLATTLASLFGAPANTTYGENTGVLVLTRVYDPKVVRIAAYFAGCISFLPIVAAAIETIPTAVIGGISFVLYGMIAAVGVRNIVESKVDFTKSRNLIIAAVILVSTFGINAIGRISFNVTGLTISLTGLAVASIAGILLNAILPGKDYEFDTEEELEEAIEESIDEVEDTAE
ncbi:MAG: uracil-xanthine permease [Clostridia bacterium]|nr:uracil-xanthine permease [Clostridia bacterium]